MIAALRSAWRARSDREQMLLLGLAVLASALIYVYGLFLPAMAARESAARRLRAASADLAQARVLAAALDQRNAESAPAITGPDGVRGAIAAAAGAAGIAFSRIADDGDGVASVWVEDAETPRLFAWIERLQSQYGLEIQRLSLQVDESGGLGAQMAVAGRGN
ncbi:MAG TPA: hypothetical protein DCZ49_06315 [Hyphomonadaceae bacterium]|nr:hypothetical protein [Hyphomonadaceae bacterium]